MKKKIIKHNQLTIGREEFKAAINVLRSGWLTSADQVKLFEKEICNFFSLPQGHALAVSSGSSAIYLALWYLKSKNKKVGIPVYSCSSLKNAAIMIGAKPHYLDSSKDNPNIDIGSINFKDIDILIAPSMYGIPIEIPKNFKKKLIEDISQAFGAKMYGKKIGLRGDIGVCSFASTKLITTGGQGGIIISKNKKIIDKLKDYRNFDNRDDKKVRFNFLMTNIQAAIGREQLKKISIFLKKREYIFNSYLKSGLNLLNSKNIYSQPVRHRALLINKNPKKLMLNLRKKNISSIIPLRIGELLDTKKNKYRNAKKFSKKLLAIPIYPSLSNINIKKIIKNCLECQ